jgi:hypothetical protein
MEVRLYVIITLHLKEMYIHPHAPTLEKAPAVPLYIHKYFGCGNEKKVPKASAGNRTPTVQFSLYVTLFNNVISTAEFMWR